MKNKLCFVLVILLVLTGLTFCVKEESPLEKLIAKTTKGVDSTAKDSLRLPSVTALRVTTITWASAILEGKITGLGDGRDMMISTGWCYSTTQNPIINDNPINKILGGIINGSQFRFDNSVYSFNATITGLNSSTTYYVRAYVTNGTITTYSNQLSFTTNPYVKPGTATIFPPSLSCTGVIVLFNVTDDCGNPATGSGVCWATTANPTTENNRGYNQDRQILFGDGGWWVSYLYDLQPATLYHVRAYWSTSAGTFYGEDISFTTHSETTIITTGVTEITTTTAKVIGNVTSTGGSFVVERGICYDTVPNLTTVIMRGGFGLADHFIEQEVQSVDGAGEFTVNMTNLIPGRCYYVSTFVGVMTGLDYGDQIISYGNEVTFTTKP